MSKISFEAALDKMTNITPQEKKERETKKQPIFVSFDSLKEMEKYLPKKLYEELEIKLELGFMHEILGHERYKEEVETIIRAKRGLSSIPVIEYKIKHRNY